MGMIQVAAQFADTPPAAATPSAGRAGAAQRSPDQGNGFEKMLNSRREAGAEAADENSEPGVRSRPQAKSGGAADAQGLAQQGSDKPVTERQKGAQLATAETDKETDEVGQGESEMALGTTPQEALQSGLVAPKTSIQAAPPAAAGAMELALGGMLPGNAPAPVVGFNAAPSAAVGAMELAPGGMLPGNAPAPVVGFNAAPSAAVGATESAPGGMLQGSAPAPVVGLNAAPSAAVGATEVVKTEVVPRGEAAGATMGTAEDAQSPTAGRNGKRQTAATSGQPQASREQEGMPTLAVAAAMEKGQMAMAAADAVGQQPAKEVPAAAAQKGSAAGSAEQLATLSPPSSADLANRGDQAPAPQKAADNAGATAAGEARGAAGAGMQNTAAAQLVAAAKLAAVSQSAPAPQAHGAEALKQENAQGAGSSEGMQQTVPVPGIKTEPHQIDTPVLQGEPVQMEAAAGQALQRDEKGAQPAAHGKGLAKEMAPSAEDAAAEQVVVTPKGAEEISGGKTASAPATAALPSSAKHAGEQRSGDARDGRGFEQKMQVAQNGTGDTAGSGVQAPVDGGFAKAADKAAKTDTPLHQSVLSQIKDGVVTHDGKGNGQMSIRLNPGELGELKIQVRMEDNRLKVEVQADNRGVKDLLMSNLDSLKEALSGKNLAMDGFDVSTGGGSFNGPSPEERENLRQQAMLWPARGGGYAGGEERQVNYSTPDANSLLDVRF